MKQGFEKSKLLKRPIFTHLMVLFGALAFSAIIYLNVINYLMESLINELKSSFASTTSVIDIKLKEAKSIYDYLEINPEFSALMYSELSEQNDNAVTMWKISKEMLRMTVVNKGVSEVGLYLNKSDKVVTSEGLFYFQDWLKLRFKGNERFAPEELSRFITMDTSKKFMVIPWRNSDSAQSLIYINKITAANNKLIATPFIILDLDLSQEYFSLLKMESFAIVDSHMNIIYTYGTILDNETEGILSHCVDKGLLTETVLLQKNIVNIRKSNSSELWYIMLSNRSSSISLIETINIIAVGCLIICLTIGLIIGIVESRRYSKGIQSVIGLINKRVSPVSKNRNEYELIKHGVENLMIELDQKDDLIWKVNLNQILKGANNSNVYEQQILEHINLKRNEGEFFLLLFSYNSIDLSDEDAQAISKSIKSVMLNTFTKELTFSIIKVDLRIICILNLPEVADSDKEQFTIKKFGQMLDIHLQSVYAMKLIIAISSKHQGFFELKLAYREVCEIVEYYIFLGITSVAEYEQINTDFKECDTLFNNAEAELKNYLSRDDFEGIQNLVSNTLEPFLNNKRIPPQQILKFKLYGFINSFINFVRNESYSNGSDFFEVIKPVDRLFNCTSLASTKKEMQDVIVDIKDYLIRLNQDRKNSLVSSIISLIEQEYGNCNLNVNMIADYFGMNQPSLSKFFKNETGLPLLEYIQRKRLEYAKIFIMQDHTLAELAALVGLNNEISLIRLFRKYENMTPAQYKERCYQFHINY